MNTPKPPMADSGPPDDALFDLPSAPQSPEVDEIVKADAMVGETPVGRFRSIANYADEARQRIEDRAKQRDTNLDSAQGDLGGGLLLDPPIDLVLARADELWKPELNVAARLGLFEITQHDYRSMTKQDRQDFSRTVAAFDRIYGMASNTNRVVLGAEGMIQENPVLAKRYEGSNPSDLQEYMRILGVFKKWLRRNDSYRYLLDQAKDLPEPRRPLKEDDLKKARIYQDKDGKIRFAMDEDDKSTPSEGFNGEISGALPAGPLSPDQQQETSDAGYAMAQKALEEARAKGGIPVRVTDSTGIDTGARFAWLGPDNLLGTKRPEKTGPAVELSPRAIALEAIFRAISISHMSKHAAQSEEFFQRYGEGSGSVLSGMDRKGYRAIREALDEHLDTLVATSDMREFGYTEAEIEEGRTRVLQSLKEYAKESTGQDRKRALRGINKTIVAVEKARSADGKITKH